MDPLVCYQDMMTSWREGEMLKAREHAKNLEQWIRRGGFYPQIPVAKTDASSRRIVSRNINEILRLSAQQTD